MTSSTDGQREALGRQERCGINARAGRSVEGGRLDSLADLAGQGARGSLTTESLQGGRTARRPPWPSLPGEGPSLPGGGRVGIGEDLAEVGLDAAGGVP